MYIREFSLLYLCNCRWKTINCHTIGFTAVSIEDSTNRKSKWQKEAFLNLMCKLPSTIHADPCRIYSETLQSNVSKYPKNMYVYVHISLNIFVCWEHFDFILYVYIHLADACQGRRESIRIYKSSSLCWPHFCDLFPGRLMIWSLPIMHQR